MSGIANGEGFRALKRNDELFHQLQTTRHAVKPILDDLKHPHFTKHDVQHSDRIVAKLSILTESLRKPLAKEECYILLSGAYVHDVGMQSDKYSDLKRIREEHHLLSHEMIVGSIEEPGKYPDLKIAKNYAPYIALIAKGHRRTDLSVDEYDEFDMGGSQIRLRLLAALLRFADQLDIDFRRVDFERLKIERDMPAESKLHWYMHNYVLGLTIEEGLIRITYRFPEEYKNQELESLIAKYVLDHILGEYELFKDSVLWSAGVQISAGKVRKQHVRVVEPLPSDVRAVLEETLGLTKAPTSVASWSNLVAKCSSETRETISRRITPRYLRQVYVPRAIERDFEEFLKGDKRLFLLVGKPGTGKTNVFCFLSQEFRPSLLLSFAEEVPSKPEFESGILHFLDADPTFEFEKLLKRVNSLSVSQSRNLIIFIDGEFSVGDFSAPGSYVLQFLQEHHDFNIKIAVACRGDSPGAKLPAAVAQLLHRQQYGTLAELDISGILGDFNNVEFEEAKDRYFSPLSFNITVAGGIQDEASVRLKNPYLFRLFCESYKNSKDIGPIRDIRYVDLCDRYWMMIYRKLEHRFPQIGVTEIRKRLYNVVKRMRENWALTLEEVQFKSIIGDEVLAYLMAEGIMTDTNGKPGTENRLAFTFDEFQEFLMSHQLLDEYNLVKSDEEQVTEQLLSLIAHSHRLSFRFGLGLIEFSILLLEKLREDDVFNKIIALVSQRDESQWKRLVCRCIAKLENINENTYHVLREICSSENQRVLMELAEVLGILAKRIPDWAEHLLVNLMDQYDERIKIRTALALLRFDESRMRSIVGHLLKLSEDDRWRVSTSIAEALQNLYLQDMSILLPLVVKLKQKGDSNTLRSLAKTLKTIGPRMLPEAIEILADIAAEGEGYHKYEAIESLSTLAGHDTNRVIEIYNTLSKNRDPLVRRAVATTVHRVDRNIAHKIWEELSDDEDTLVRMAVWRRLVDVREIDRSDTSIILGTEKYLRGAPFRTVVKRAGQVEMFQFERIAGSILAAAKDVGGKDQELAVTLAIRVVKRLSTMFPGETQISTKDINDAVERVLIKHGHTRTARSYLKYRFNKYKSSSSG